MHPELTSILFSPSLNLASLRDSSSMALRAFSYCDVLHCICVPRRRTLFTFTDSSNDASPSPLPSEIDRAIETHIGLPVGLLLCLAATCNLSAEMAGLSPEVIKTKAAVIEKAIKDWRPLTPDAAALADSTAYIDELRYVRSRRERETRGDANFVPICAALLKCGVM